MLLFGGGGGCTAFVVGGSDSGYSQVILWVVLRSQQEGQRVIGLEADCGVLDACRVSRVCGVETQGPRVGLIFFL